MRCCRVQNVDSHLTYLPPTVQPFNKQLTSEQFYASTESQVSTPKLNEEDKKFFESIVRPANKEEMKIYKFQCPICSLFFKRILGCVKCKNYICIECIKNIKEFANKTQGMEKCPFCSVNSEKFQVLPVDNNELVRTYSDIALKLNQSPTNTNNKSRKSSSLFNSVSELTVRKIRHSIQKPQESFIKKVKHRVSQSQQIIFFKE